MPNTARPADLSPIAADVAYPLVTFMRLTGATKREMRAHRQRGLMIRRAGRRAWILGRDFLNYLESLQPELAGVTR